MPLFVFAATTVASILLGVASILLVVVMFSQLYLAVFGGCNSHLVAEAIATS